LYVPSFRIAIPGRTPENPGMSRERNLPRVLECGLVAVVRAADPTNLVDVIRSLADGGVTVAEVTFTVPDAVEVIRAAKKQLGDQVLLGAGTVLDAETARAALLAGAEFVVSPTLDCDVIKLCRRYDKLVFPGAFTPTEVLAAWEAGADVVKVFPADVLGPAFFKAMRGPLPQIRLMPTGGVDLNTASEYLRAGACCLGVGSQLVDPKAVARQDYEYLRGLAWQFTQAVRLGRAE
jgi:2-dehydro-3-deoxyphosphogluconate aldolase/(4S)-4-hydroxy-2-oxoglutarate aldolase